MSGGLDVEVFAAGCLAAALLHGLAAARIQALAAPGRRFGALIHLLGEVELVFVSWSLVMLLGWTLLGEPKQALHYLATRRYAEPLFVFAVMVVVGTRPMLQFVGTATARLGRLMPARGAEGLYFATLAFLPLLGSLVTEIAAMTVAALVLRDRLFMFPLSARLRYATLGVLFVNVSIGGMLTDFAAPPVLMVAGRWGWGSVDMFRLFGLRATVAVLFNATVATWLFRRELRAVAVPDAVAGDAPPRGLVLAHGIFLAVIVMAGHEPGLFLPVLLLFLVMVRWTGRHQSPVIWRESAFVSLFLAGLVVLGGMQRWWLQPALEGFGSDRVFYGSALLTAVTDNAALAYMGSLVDGSSLEFKVSLLSGAVAGGGLTVIANAPNPAGVALLRGRLPGGRLRPLLLLLAALPPTLVAVLAFRL